VRPDSVFVGPVKARNTGTAGLEVALTSDKSVYLGGNADTFGFAECSSGNDTETDTTDLCNRKKDCIWGGKDVVKDWDAESNMPWFDHTNYLQWLGLTNESHSPTASYWCPETWRIARCQNLLNVSLWPSDLFKQVIWRPNDTWRRARFAEYMPNLVKKTKNLHK